MSIDLGNNPVGTPPTSEESAQIRNAIGSINYPYTTDFISGAEHTRNLTSITESVYAYNSNLTSIYIGSNVTSIGDFAFSYCSNLTSITIPDSVTSIGFYGFDNTGIISITIPNSVTSIGAQAFYTSSLTNITLPNSITTLAYGIFESCFNLTNVTIPDSVTSIERNAFYNCTSLLSITIPKNVTSIGDFAFSQAYNLTTVNCLATTAPTLGSNVFALSAATEIHVPVGATGYGATYGGLTVIYDL